MISMSEVKHTPWSWSEDGMWLHDANGDFVLSYTNRDDGLHGEPEAKALIAAAPEMLEALRDVATFARVFRGRMENVPGDEALEALGETVAAAIDKAEGRS